MSRTKPRTYQGHIIPKDGPIRADLAVSVDRRGTFSPTPQQQARAAMEAAQYYKVEPAPLEPEF